ncbi:MAG: hypothetical protein P8O03_05590 [Ilumatobacter sp.]|nr:hypothetical protein [bacterium]MCP4835459.1 hypothetical protein [Phycisphaera sp.]MDG1265779.1 hypothetical protein [Ilumatobacter sp.]NKB40539.1 hypothetical protein [Ilumatobacter sp.]
MRQRRHALSGALYDVRDDGNVDVTSREGVTGTFTVDGEWISGDLRHADPHLCGWLAGPQLPPRLAVLPRFRSTDGAAPDTTSTTSDTEDAR